MLTLPKLASEIMAIGDMWQRRYVATDAERLAFEDAYTRGYLGHFELKK